MHADLDAAWRFCVCLIGYLSLALSGAIASLTDTNCRKAN